MTHLPLSFIALADTAEQLLHNKLYATLLSPMEKYVIGIDTGGTFTDAVLLEGKTGRVLHSAKVPTTHQTLSEGTSKVLHNLLKQSQIPPSSIKSVAISTTLATNSVVEKKGARVALLVIGYVKHFKLPVKAVVFIKGGHTITGQEEEPLDLEYVVSLLDNLKEEIDAYGVCSAMSFKNPAHELVCEKAIHMLDPKPVFLSHRISSQAGMQERAATAGLHAKLMPVMQDFIAGVEKGMDSGNISCPMRIIGGDSTSIGSQRSVEQAGMTVASGPACTAHFGSLHTKQTALIVDIGGTTTDITMLLDGKPMLAKNGCRIGDWSTHVEAIDMMTRGIGGDSHVALDGKNALHLGPRRVIPLVSCGFARSVKSWLGIEGNSKCISLLSQPTAVKSSAQSIIETLKQQGPCTTEKLKQVTQLSGIPLEKQLEDLSRGLFIEETGFTPTDALHVLGELHFGEVKIAIEAADILGKILGVNGKLFSSMVIDKTVEAIENSILEYITNHYWKKTLANFISTRDNHPVLGVNFSLKIPIIGVGAAAPFFLPQVAQNLGTTVTFPENYEVGNAIGAARILSEEADDSRQK